MTTAAEFLALAKRIEREEPSRALDLAIANCTLDVGAHHWMWLDDSKTMVVRHVYGPCAPGNPVATLETFTKDIGDAAEALPDNVIAWIVGGPSPWAQVKTPAGIYNAAPKVKDATHAQALVAAALRARAAMVPA